MRTKRIRLNREVRITPRALREWAFDAVKSTLPFFAEVHQSPAFVVGPGVEKSDAVRKSLKREVRKTGEHAVFVAAVPRSSRCVAVKIEMKRSACPHCSEPSKTVSTTLTFFDHGKIVPGPAEHQTPGVCPACQMPDELDEGPVHGSPVPNPNENPRTHDPLLEALDEFLSDEGSDQKIRVHQNGERVRPSGGGEK